MNTLNEEILFHYRKDLDQLKKEILAYENEADLWVTAGEIKNSAGNLCYHILGNLNHFIGFGLGNTGYKRDRPKEFSIKDYPREKLVSWIDETMAMLEKTITEAGDLEQAYPEEIWGHPGPRHTFIIRFLTHLNYHLGQVNYHRRLIQRTV
ncbi:MAG: DUF1572 family protein [Bacteroidota bacterium]